MSVTVSVNGLSLCHSLSGGVSMATLPDVCVTPGAGPVPYPNVAFSRDLAKGTTTVSADGADMCANFGSEFARSTGDEPGTAGGVVSHVNTREATWLTYSFDVMLEGKGACRLTDKMFHNRRNTVNMAGLLQAPVEVQAQARALCPVMCQCASQPTPSRGTGRKLRQECVKQSLDALGGPHCNQSPFRAEISYNMTTVPPSPLMTRDPGQELCRSEYWQARAQQEIDGYQRGTGMVRRPDVVIVHDPKRPPTQANVSGIVEMKFEGDELGDGQLASYGRIAGDPNRVIVLREQDCGCKRQRQEEPQPVTVLAPAPARSGQSHKVAAGVGILAVLAVAAFILAPEVAVPAAAVAAAF